MTFNTMKYWCTVTWEQCTFAIALEFEAHANAHIHTWGKHCKKPLTGSWFPQLLWRLFLELLESGSHWDHCTQRGDHTYRSNIELSQVVRQSLTLLYKGLMWSLKCTKGTSETERSPTKLSSFHTGALLCQIYRAVSIHLSETPSPSSDKCQCTSSQRNLIVCFECTSNSGTGFNSLNNL